MTLHNVILRLRHSEINYLRILDKSSGPINSKGVKREVYLVNLEDFVNTPSWEDYKNLTPRTPESGVGNNDIRLGLFPLVRTLRLQTSKGSGRTVRNSRSQLILCRFLRFEQTNKPFNLYTNIWAGNEPIHTKGLKITHQAK